MVFAKFAASVVGGSAIATAMLGGVVKLVQVIQAKSAIAAESKALTR